MSRTVRAAHRLVERSSATYAATPRFRRPTILKNFIGWAYAHRHDVPRTTTEIDALSLAFETLLIDGKDEGWISDFKRMIRARNEVTGWRARQWFRIYKTMKRTLPMRHDAGEANW